MGLKEEKELISFFVLDTQYSIIPTFHQSIGPLFQRVSQLGCSTWSKASEIPYAQQVTEILPLKIVSGAKGALFMEDG
jgi:hypothetical protein